MKDIKRHIERIQKSYRKIEKITISRRKIQREIEPTLAIQKTLELRLKNLEKLFKQINKIYASISKIENPILEHLDSFKEIGKRLKEYAEKTPEHLLLIAQNGWFIEMDSKLSLPSEIASEIKKDSVETANEILIDYYSSNIDRIFERLKKRHPTRKKILNEILISYKNENYSLLIPGVLSQVDGICFDFTKLKFFIKGEKYLPQITSELEKHVDDFLYLYLSPLQNNIPIMAGEKYISKFPCQLNRHEILHGINTDYGTKINSLKVISLLKYMSDLLVHLDKKSVNTTKNIVAKDKK